MAEVVESDCEILFQSVGTYITSHGDPQH